jgi:ATP-grasp domain
MEASMPQSPAEGPVTSPYPERWVVDALLRDGAAVALRPIRPDDGAALSALHDGLSPETVSRRSFSFTPHLTDRDVERFTHVDDRDRMAFVAVLGDDLIGVGRYERIPGSDEDARELVRSIRDAPLLFGDRGALPVDVPALEGLLLRVARLAEDVHEIAEMDLDPVIVSPGGVSVIDVRPRLVPFTPHPELTVRRLRPAPAPLPI